MGKTNFLIHAEQPLSHVISADAHIYRHGNSKVILGPASRTRSAQPAGKKNEKS